MSNLPLPAKVHKDPDPRRDAQLRQLYEHIEERVGRASLDLQAFLAVFQEMAAAIQISFPNGIESLGVVSLGHPQPVAIASGAIQMRSSRMVIDTEAAAAADDLDNVNGGKDGDLLILTSTNAARVPTVRHNGGGSGNIRLDGGVNFALTNPVDTLTLIRSGGLWLEQGGRCNNG